MRPVPTTDAETARIDAGVAGFDDALGVYTFFLRIPRAEAVYFRLVVESWEDFAVVRTVERFHEGDRGRSVVVVMAVPDYVGPCSQSLARLCAEVGGEQVESTPERRTSLRRDLLDGAEAS